MYYYYFLNLTLSERKLIFKYKIRLGKEKTQEIFIFLYALTLPKVSILGHANRKTDFLALFDSLTSIH